MSPGPNRSNRLTPVLLALLVLASTLASACARTPPARPGPAEASTPAAAATTGGATPASELRPTAASSPTAPAASAVPSASPAAARTPTPTLTPMPTSTPPPRPTFTVEVDPPFIGRGETLLVRVTGRSAGTVNAGGRSVPLVANATGAWAVVGIGLYADLGATSLRVAAQDAQGIAVGEVVAAYTVVDPKRPADYLVVTEEVGAILTPDAGIRETQLRAEQFARFDPMPRWRTAFRHPLLTIEVTTPFGSGRSINGGPIGDFHSGEDLAANDGTPVTAAAPGRVAWAGAMPIRGNSVIVDHGGGVMTGYHHLRDTSVTAGQQIEAGVLVGHVGSTGFSTGPHLHWELTIYGVNVDPETWATRLFPR